MNTDALLALLVALGCIGALGVSASTLPSSVSTRPDDVVDVDYADLPIGHAQADSLKRQLNGDAPPRPAAASSNDRSTNADASRTDARAARSTETSGGTGPARPSLLDRLLALLGRVAMIAALLLGAVLAAVLAWRHRTAFRASRDDPPNAPTAASDGGFDASYGVGPSNAVYRAWIEMARRAGIDDLESATPAECARAARRAGLDEAAVRALTEEFEAVRYGGAPVTTEREARVREHCERLDGGA